MTRVENCGGFYLEPPHVSWVSCIFQTVLVALEEKLQKESVETQRGQAIFEVIIRPE